MEELIERSWQEVLADELRQAYWSELAAFVDRERTAHPDAIYPPTDQVFAALSHTPYEKVKVVLLGQDPYHGPGQAHGLSFSVPPGVKLPPSLRNIFREMVEDLSVPFRENGCLEDWADQGVLLLNNVLTVRRGEAHSHRKRGWERFTDAMIARLAARHEPLVFLLWGKPAQKKAAKIDTRRHIVIEAAHPSPLSAHRGFFGSRPFSSVNRALKQFGNSPIAWARET